MLTPETQVHHYYPLFQKGDKCHTNSPWMFVLRVDFQLSLWIMIWPCTLWITQAPVMGFCSHTLVPIQTEKALNATTEKHLFTSLMIKSQDYCWCLWQNNRAFTLHIYIWSLQMSHTFRRSFALNKMRSSS